MPFPIAAVASLLGPLLGKAAGGASSERQNQNDYALRQAQLAQQGHQFDTSAGLQAAGMNENATMDRAKLGIQAPQQRARQALLGSLLKNAQSTKVAPPAGIRMGQVSGGLSDISGLLADARDAGGMLAGNATKAIETGSDVPAYMDVTSQLSKSPDAPSYKGAGALESILSGGGSLASILAALLNKGGSGSGKDPGGPWA